MKFIIDWKEKTYYWLNTKEVKLLIKEYELCMERIKWTHLSDKRFKHRSDMLMYIQKQIIKHF